MYIKTNYVKTVIVEPLDKMKKNQLTDKKAATVEGKIIYLIPVLFVGKQD